MVEHARILVVDDDESIRKTLEAILRGKGYHVDTAENGKQAIEKTNNDFYNVALIDVRLPDMDGTELIGRLKETEPRMAKIILTGFPSQQNAIDAVNKGADGYVLKPFDAAGLLMTIEKHLKRQKESIKYSGEKVAEYIETRVRELEQEKKSDRAP